MAREDLVQDFAQLVSRHGGRLEPSFEDSVLADFLVSCLEAYGEVSADTDIWKIQMLHTRVDPWDSGFDAEDMVKYLLRE